MNRDDIVNFVHEAGIIPPGWGATENQWQSLHRFAKLVAQHEREICAQICDHEMDNATNFDRVLAYGNCSDYIRAREDK